MTGVGLIYIWDIITRNIGGGGRKRETELCKRANEDRNYFVLYSIADYQLVIRAYVRSIPWILHACIIHFYGHILFTDFQADKRPDFIFMINVCLIIVITLNATYLFIRLLAIAVLLLSNIIVFFEVFWFFWDKLKRIFIFLSLSYWSYHFFAVNCLITNIIRILKFIYNRVARVCISLYTPIFSLLHSISYRVAFFCISALCNCVHIAVNSLSYWITLI